MSANSVPNVYVSIVSLLACLPLLGCVSQGTYDQLAQERNELALERDELQRRASMFRSAALGLSTELALREQQVAQLEREQQELADEVSRWALRGRIEMQLLKDGLHLLLPHDVLFHSGASRLSPEGRELVMELVEEIKQQPYQIAVLGFTDNVPVGPALVDRYPSNWDLAAARAGSVVRLMQASGIPGSQLLLVSQGENHAIASNDTPEGRSANRRIDVRLRPVVN